MAKKQTYEELEQKVKELEMESELKRSDEKELIRAPFNKQAENFSKWSVTQNEEYLEAYFTFCRMLQDDSLLDVACGTGEFSLDI